MAEPNFQDLRTDRAWGKLVNGLATTVPQRLKRAEKAYLKMRQIRRMR